MPTGVDNSPVKCRRESVSFRHHLDGHAGGCKGLLGYPGGSVKGGGMVAEIPVESSANRTLKNPILFPPSGNGDVLAPGDNHKRFQGWTVVKHVRANKSQTDAHLAVNMRVCLYRGTHAESPGMIVEDFGDLAGKAVDIGGHHINPARRWAVVLDTGDLVFADTDELVAD